MSPTLRWHVYPAPEQVAQALVDDIAKQAARALAARDRYSIVLAGGATPRLTYTVLRGIETDWQRWHIYFTDERCLPRDDPERNDTTARSAWLDRVAIPRAQVHSIPAELGADAAAAAYRQELREVAAFDTTLLGLGEDGHTASLFPGQPAGHEPGAPDVLAVHGAPKEPAERVTLGAKRLAAARHVELLVTGTAKQAAVAQLRAGADVPIAYVAPERGIDVWLDAAAYT